MSVKSKEKPEEKTKKRKKSKKKGHRFLKTLVIILVLGAVLVGASAAASAVTNKGNREKLDGFPAVPYDAQLVPTTDGFGNVSFVTDRALKVLQLTDVHIGGGWMSGKKDAMALNAVAAMVTAEQPDLVIVTGDVAYPVPFQAGTLNNKNSAELFAELMERLGVYWTLTFGNHDTELYAFYTREDMAEFYQNHEAYPHCLFTPGPAEVDGCCNQVISIQNTKGEYTRLLIGLDSHSYIDGDFLGAMWKYDNIHENQVAWYQKVVADYTAANAEKGVPGVVKSSLFFHIPLVEYKDAWYEYVNNGFRDTENVQFVSGEAGEEKKVIFCGIHEDDLFETVCELGSTDMIFCGHDHYNNFDIIYKGVHLTYGMSVDYLAYPGIYREGTQRGCTVLTFAPDGTYARQTENYYQEKYASVYDKETVTMQTMVPVSEFPAEAE